MLWLASIVKKLYLCSGGAEESREGVLGVVCHQAELIC